MLAHTQGSIGINCCNCSLVEGRPSLHLRGSRYHHPLGAADDAGAFRVASLRAIGPSVECGSEEKPPRSARGGLNHITGFRSLALAAAGWVVASSAAGRIAGRARCVGGFAAGVAAALTTLTTTVAACHGSNSRAAAARIPGRPGDRRLYRLVRKRTRRVLPCRRNSAFASRCTNGVWTAIRPAAPRLYVSTQRSAADDCGIVSSCHRSRFLRLRCDWVARP